MHVSKELANSRSGSSSTLNRASVILEPLCPDRVSEVLRTGIHSRRIVYPEHGGYRVCEVWEPPKQIDVETRSKLNSYFVQLDAYMTPAPRSALLSRILALLSHYRLEAHSPQVEACIADDWADDLGNYPLWAVNLAARSWRRNKRFKPQISEMIESCEEAVKELKIIYSRLQSIVHLDASIHVNDAV